MKRAVKNYFNDWLFLVQLRASKWGITQSCFLFNFLGSYSPTFSFGYVVKSLRGGELLQPPCILQFSTKSSSNCILSDSCSLSMFNLLLKLLFCDSWFLLVVFFKLDYEILMIVKDEMSYYRPYSTIGRGLQVILVINRVYDYVSVCRGTAANHIIYHSNLNLLTLYLVLLSVW